MRLTQQPPTLWGLNVNSDLSPPAEHRLKHGHSFTLPACFQSNQQCFWLYCCYHGNLTYNPSLSLFNCWRKVLFVLRPSTYHTTSVEVFVVSILWPSRHLVWWNTWGSTCQNDASMFLWLFGLTVLCTAGDLSHDWAAERWMLICCFQTAHVFFFYVMMRAELKVWCHAAWRCDVILHETSVSKRNVCSLLLAVKVRVDCEECSAAAASLWQI